MNKKQRFSIFLVLISLVYFIYLILGIFEGGTWFYPKSYGMKLIFLVLSIIITMILVILYVMERYDGFKKIGLFSIKFHIVEVVIISILIALLFALGGLMIYDYSVISQRQENHLSIGIYLSDSEEPLYFSGKTVNNPVLTQLDITDMQAKFVADPFLIYDNDTFYMFFEVYDLLASKGDIGIAESNDGFDWTYKQIVLEEPFHLSYPCVFQYNNEYYMIPETVETSSIRLYKAYDFPYTWLFEKTLISGKDFVDSTIFYYNTTWWLFTQTNNDYSLHLYFSDSPLGVWIEHPHSPIISHNANISRPGGNVIVYNNRIFRYTQDDYPSYGTQIWAFEITQLTKTEYIEKRIGETPLLKGYDNWNELGMHHISMCKLDDQWIAAVDGKGRS